MTGAITAILSIISLLVEAWLAATPQRVQEDRNATIQKGRADIAIGDANAVSERIDSLLTVSPPGTSGASGEHDTSDLLQQFSREEGIEILPDRT